MRARGRVIVPGVAGSTGAGGTSGRLRFIFFCGSEIEREIDTEVVVLFFILYQK